MRALVSSFWLPRGGSRTEEYEDAFYPRREGRRTARLMRFAVADGASESMLSGLWADLLVRTWCRSKRRRMGEIVATAMSGWHAEMGDYLDGRERRRRPIQWYEEPLLASGAHATLLGLELTNTSRSGGRWAAVSMGDSCLFQVRDDELVRSFPMSAAADFTTSPKLVSSRPHDLARVLDNLDTTEGEWRRGDLLFLATDALAAWFLAAHEAGDGPWRVLCRFERDAPELFAAWVGEQRGRRRLRNDDVTLLRIEVEEG